MDFEKLINNMTPDIHASLKRAVELGKWPDGQPLTAEQRALCMEAVIVYDSNCLDEDKRVGYIDRGSKSEGEICDDTVNNETPLKWS